MFIWGWIPHLYPSFGMEYPPDLFYRVVKSMNGKEIHPNDDDPLEVASIELIDVPGAFVYGEECIGFKITVRTTELVAMVTVYETGMVCYRVDDGNGLDNNQIRFAVREIYFVMKNLYHVDIHHCSDRSGSMTMKYGDDNFTVVFGESIGTAVESIFSEVIHKCEDNLKRYWVVESGNSISHSTMYLFTTGFITYGRNLISVHRHILGSRYELFVQSLDCCVESLHSLDSDEQNTADHIVTNSTAEITQIANQISIRMLLLTFLSTGVAFFAGSILADSLAEMSLNAKAMTTAVAGIIVVGIGYKIWSWKPAGRRGGVKMDLNPED